MNTKNIKYHSFISFHSLQFTSVFIAVIYAVLLYSSNGLFSFYCTYRHFVHCYHYIFSLVLSHLTPAFVMVLIMVVMVVGVVIVVMVVVVVERVVPS